jgi:hypothetical protein
VQYVTANIEDIKAGDLVYSYDTITGEVSQKEVTATFVRESHHLNYLTIVDEDGREQIIETTDSHPFWVVTGHPELWRAAQEVVNENGTTLYHENLGVTENGYWVEAKDLKVGDVFIGANGKLSVLLSKERVEFAENVTVYNFTVDGNHDYFVIAQTAEYGQTSVLVHNTCWSQGKYPTNGQNAFYHWTKHKKEFPELNNAKEYVDMAKDISQNVVALTKTRTNGEHLYYLQSTNTFVVTLSDGTPKTMFRPKNGIQYWNAQN